MHAPRKQGKKKSVTGRRYSERSTLELIAAYRRALSRFGIEETEFDLENEFFWLFRLDRFIALAYRTFDSINREHFQSSLSRPTIIFCNRSSGGYYHKSRHTIGISLAMTVEYGEAEFMETLLHEIAHILVQSHSPAFYNILGRIGGSGRKAPTTLLLRRKRERFLTERYPIRVRCPECKKEYRYRTRRALSYACRPCCERFSGGRFDVRFRFVPAEG